MISHRLMLQVIRMGGVLLFLSGCGTYGLPPTALPSTSTPASVPSTEISTPATSAGTASPLTGSVVIGKGNCCMGGVAGDTIQAPVEFSAASPFGKVTEMRVKASSASGCLTEVQMETADWEPFVPTNIFPISVAINWTSFIVSAQFRDEAGNVSPVYCDDISVEGSPPVPLVDPSAWYPQIQCFSENEVHPGPGETVKSAPTTFSWPNKNNLPEGVFYKVFVYGAKDNYTALIVSGQTRETSLTLQIPPENLGDVVWYVTLVDANGAFLDHGKCSSFPASLLTVDPPTGIKGIYFLYQP